jgi:hypothetical protein
LSEAKSPDGIDNNFSIPIGIAEQLAPFQGAPSAQTKTGGVDYDTTGYQL